MEIPALPESLERTVEGFRWHQVGRGHASARVYALTRPSQLRRYLKVGGLELRAEAERLDWLQRRAPVPAVVAYQEEANRAFLLLEALPGLDATEAVFGTYLVTTVRQLGAALRALHELPWDDCPFDHRLASEVGAARANLEAGRVEPAAFEERWRDRSPEGLFEELLASRPEREDVVLTHGDACLPNIVLNGDRHGFVDVGRAGVGDRYRDLALAARSLEYNWGGRWLPLLFEGYGLERPDAAKLAYYRLLDAFC